MEQESHSALWFLFGLAVVGGVAWAVYKTIITERKEEQKGNAAREKKQKQDKLSQLTSLCWDMFVAFQQQDKAFDTWRQIISADGLFSDYQLLIGVLKEDISEKQKSQIIQQVIANNLINLLESKLVCEEGTWKVRKVKNVGFTRESFLHNLGYREKMEDNLDEIIYRMTEEIQHLKDKISQQKEDGNYQLYNRLFSQLIQYVNEFCNTMQIKGMNSQEVIQKGQRLADNMREVMDANGISTVSFDQCPPDKKAIWFIPTGDDRELPAIVRESTAYIYRKGTYKNK